MTIRQESARKIYEICLLISRLVMMNLLWIVFTAIGLVVFGLVPATVTVIEIFRSYEREGDTFSWFKRAWESYGRNLRRFWGLSALLSVACIGLVLGSWMLNFQGSAVAWLPLAVLVYLVGLVLPYLAANEVNFDVSRFALLKNSLMLPVMWGWTSLRILLAEAAVIVLCVLLPGLIPVMAVSVPLFLASALLTARWSKQLVRLGREALPVDVEQQATPQQAARSSNMDDSGSRR